MNTTESASLIVVLVGVFVLILFVALAVKVKAFRDDLEYLNMEIRRTTGSDRKYWKKKRRKLWLSLLFGIRAR